MNGEWVVLVAWVAGISLLSSRGLQEGEVRVVNYE